MCGIAVVIEASRTSARVALELMNASQRHRGPDDGAIALFDLPDGRALGLGFRRLAIQDLSARGHQPMVHEPTGTVIVFNGEIYNFRTLRDQLERLGYTFRGHSDTEVILAGFDAWGHEVFRKLAGMYAIALWEPRLSTLTIARDPIGIKPLYVALTSAGWAMASEIRALRASALVSEKLDLAALGTFLAYGAVQEPLTILQAVRPLMPGTYRTYRFGPSSVDSRDCRFWIFPDPAAVRESEASFYERLGSVLRDAVADHLVADVPIGVLLSRGVDSTTLLKLASDARPGGIDAFTVSVGHGTEFDEAPIAAASARRFGARFHRVEVSTVEAEEAFVDWLASMDQPTIDGLNTLVVARAVKRAGITVALSGLGADELFGGYASFRSSALTTHVSRVAALLPREVRSAIARAAAGSISDRPRPLKALEALLSSEGADAQAAIAHRRLLSNVHLEALGFGKPETLGLSEHWLPIDSDALAPTLANGPTAIRSAEFRGYMRNMLLRDSDVFSMATSLELRVPFLDQRVVDLALTRPLPPSAQQPSKVGIIEKMIGALPDEVVRRPKQGFSLDYDRFMQQLDPITVRDAFVSVQRRLHGPGARGAVAAIDFDRHRKLAVWLADRALDAA
jgi:asparagine synthase (glutamine-hydrolysing)